MKNSIKNLATLVIVAFMTFSFTTAEGDKKEIKLENSTVVWKGYKVTGSHEGTISIKSGHLIFEGHLKSNDFFGVEEFPTAALSFKTVTAVGKNAYDVTGDITIKGKTETVLFTVSVYGSKANVSLKIDRTKYGVRYGSTSFFDGLKDKAIYDEFDLVADLEF
jgi:polyisoprenoid-binding protein YceI